MALAPLAGRDREQIIVEVLTLVGALAAVAAWAVLMAWVLITILPAIG